MQKERWTSRKFWSAMFWQSVITVMRSFDVLPTDAYVSLTYLIIGGYFLSNVSEHYIYKGEK